MKSSIVSVLSLAATVVSAAHFTSLKVPIPPEHEGHTMITHLTQAATQNVTGTAFFDQLLDHNDPKKGTFKQQYWWDASQWAGPGSPVVFFTPGEAAAAPYTGYLTNRTLSGYLGQEIKGAVILFEHRYYGSSSPFDTLSVKNLQYLTVKQAIADGTYFARNVALPFDTDHKSNAPQAPWVFSGGSYSGALAAWTESVAPGTFWAYHASSAPVQAIDDFWQYFVPVQEGMPQNCSKDVSLVIDHIDGILAKGTSAQKTALKAQFGLEDVKHDADFASVLQSGPYQWQGLEEYTGYSAFYQFCDAVENVVAGAKVTPGANGVGLKKALAGYASWINATISSSPDACTYYGYDEYDLSCFNTFDPKNKIFTDLSVGNTVNRQWEWILCNEPLSYWQDGAPKGRPSIVSRTVTASYWARQCSLYFPTENGYTYGGHKGLTVNNVNAWDKGWKLDHTTRLTWTNGQYDPWITGSVSSEFRPGGPLPSTPGHPVNIIPGGVHCYDLLMSNGEYNAGVQNVIDIETAQIVKWVSEFYKK